MLNTSPFIMSYQYPDHGPGPGHDAYHYHYLEAGKPVHIALWVFFSLFAAGVAGTLLLARRVENKIRVFHYLSALLLTFTAFTYFCLATGLGIQHRHHRHRHDQPPHHHDPNPPIGIPEKPAPVEVYFREIFWMQEAAHTVTLPLLIVMFAILSGTAPLHAVTAAISAAFSCASTIAADHFPSRRRSLRPRLAFIGWSVLALLFTLCSWSMLFFPGITAVRTRRRSTQGRYTLGVTGLVIGWIAYPVIWFLGTGTNVLSVNAQIITQGAIDVATQLGLVFFILFTHVHDPEDPVWSFPEWFVNPRACTGPDGRGAYAPVPTADTAAQGDNGNTAA
ncbi:hypothetical protein CcaverHIS002_0605230 [Cutaneotrichosporon cavernicola]|uniref:Family A G protein-coupled receptor-like protein n=1 Tax=Cutaneotrichosporon cavernicola TaxID=279322 RepID=A0AA48L8L8_9TREE|nr:uncharacterized protein CcaverHIS019_0604680 [Cutaneotrichosporon cavernicola]BEI86236.1 hypothetical protein CcaverHIS002_0605230 [Cutaneotrichosporon cavernicola]BEI94009.1 hypothetical protein CcaverHIS019_0604680 [Cutaneotrichosporon cavernicola]